MVTADNVDAALEIIDQEDVGLVLADIRMPWKTGIDLLKEVSSSHPDVGVIMVSGVTDLGIAMDAIRLGAYDYITKPFSPRELVARLKAVLRRATPPGVEETIEVNGLILDPVCHRVMAHDKAVDVGPTEYRLLQFFMTHQERAYSRSQLLDQVWGGNVYVEERTVDVHIRRLRKALGNKYEHLVQTVRGTGYRFSTKA